ncbi:DNA polymerase IV [Lichenihabitans sp. Uapishka_5]|uniref:DNA polymerase IV n=1 Tax=Lichenihabitans sp. Uapishka_5 TaxID=3037302 RepID=UPI0029E7E7C1|nr:DNA polymerase IV [Lichenihabitans sp. Uapishka_5]MDX7951672.1 DNA polymerase IV [Lichenihabitans sp. Uapishka_5]
MDPEASSRKIIHVDMDAFYASVEQRDDPALRGRPLAVGGSRERGVVAAASYEARRFGVRSAMPSVTARRLCPELLFVSPRFDVYKDVSAQIRAIFERYTDVIEPLSLDEAYLDVTADPAGLGTATAIAEAIRAAIRAETGLTASAGVSYNKFLAKLASDHHKPDGLCIVTPRQGETFVAGLPVSRFHGVGPVTAAKMARLGIATGADLKNQSLAFLQDQFGKSADYYYWAARGRDERPVRAHRIRKSIGAERTFPVDLRAEADLLAALGEIATKVWDRVTSGNSFGRTVTLKVKFDTFRQLTRAQSHADVVTSFERFAASGGGLLRDLCPMERGVRLLGITLSGFEPPRDLREEQLGFEI